MKRRTLQRLEAADVTPLDRADHKAFRPNGVISMNPGMTRAETVLAAYERGGRLPHAVLVEGRPAENVLEFAKKVAALALCSSDGARPCGVCRDCLKTERGVHPDLSVVLGGDKARSFLIDSVRAVRQEAYIRPSEAESRVFLLHNVQNMTAQAQNALLKIVEEPPKSVYFVMTCENKSTLLPTLLSRVAVLTVDGKDEEASDMRQKAKEALDILLTGKEFDALVLFSSYERDRTGFAALLKALKGEAAARLAFGTKQNTLDRYERDKLFKLAAAAEELEAALGQNAGGLLLTAIMPVLYSQITFQRKNYYD